MEFRYNNTILCILLSYIYFFLISVSFYIIGCIQLYFQAHPKYLSCIATCCFYIAVRTIETSNVFIPNATELIKLSQCGGTGADLSRMERLILEKLQWQLNAITPLTFLRLFYETLGIKSQENAITSLIAKLEVLVCQFEFTKFRVSCQICTVCTSSIYRSSVSTCIRPAFFYF